MDTIAHATMLGENMGKYLAQSGARICDTASARHAALLTLGIDCGDPTVLENALAGAYPAFDTYYTAVCNARRLHNIPTKQGED